MVVLIARFVAVLRSVVGFVAGANRMPFANFMIANSAGAVAWALFYGLGAYYLGKGVEEFARPFAMALAVVGAIVVVSMILYWRRKEQELAAAAERDIPGPLQAEKNRNHSLRKDNVVPTARADNSPTSRSRAATRLPSSAGGSCRKSSWSRRVPPCRP